MIVSITRAAVIGAAGCAIVALAAFAPSHSARTERSAPSHDAAPPAAMRAGIDAALAHSVAGWNSGNLTEFMELYLDDNRTTYATKSKYLHGRSEIAAHYASSFKPGAQRDSLRIEHVVVDSLTPTIAQVMAFYVLFRGDSTTDHGPTSLIMERVQGTWFLVHDHSG